MNLRVFISESEVFGRPRPVSLVPSWADNVVGLALTLQHWDVSGGTELRCREVLAAESDIGGDSLQELWLWLDISQARCGDRPQNEGKGGAQTHSVWRVSECATATKLRASNGRQKKAKNGYPLGRGATWDERWTRVKRA